MITSKHDGLLFLIQSQVLAFSGRQITSENVEQRQHTVLEVKCWCGTIVNESKTKIAITHDHKQNVLFQSHVILKPKSLKESSLAYNT